jgi:hypothetical protein
MDVGKGVGFGRGFQVGFCLDGDVGCLVLVALSGLSSG